MCKRCACFLFWISFSATPWENHCCIWCWIRYHLPKVLLGRTQPVAPELVCLLLRMLRILFLLGWGRKRQRYFVKAHEVLEFCLWESSVTSMAGGSVPSLLGVRNSQISGVSLSQECPQHGHPHQTPTEAGLSQNCISTNSFAMKELIFYTWEGIASDFSISKSSGTCCCLCVGLSSAEAWSREINISIVSRTVHSWLIY